MGVYVPNIKKPKHCTECYFVSRDQCELQDNSYDYDTFKEQRKHCPLIEIDHTNTELLEFFNDFKKWKASKEVDKYINAVYGERSNDVFESDM